MRRITSTKGAIQHGDSYIKKKGDSASFPDDVAAQIVKSGRAKYATESKKAKPSTAPAPAPRA